MRLRLSILAGLCAGGGGLAFLLFGWSQPPSAFTADVRCLYGCVGPAFTVLPTGPLPALVASGEPLVSAQGQPITVTRASTESCATALGGTATIPANRACVETKGILVQTSTADDIAAPAVAFSGRSVTMSADVVIKAFGSGYAMAIQLQNGFGDRFQLSVGPDGSGRCDYYNGTVYHADEFDALVTANVRAHLFCSYDGSHLRVCVNGSGNCASTSAVFSVGTSYTPVLGSFLGSSNFLDGWLAYACADSTLCI